MLLLASVAPWLLVTQTRRVDHLERKPGEFGSTTRVDRIKRRQFLKANYRHGDGILFSFGDLTGVLREAGIPLRESLYDGNNPQFLARPLRAPIFSYGKSGR